MKRKFGVHVRISEEKEQRHGQESLELSIGTKIEVVLWI